MDRAVYRRMAEQEERHWWFAARRGIVERLIGRFLPDKADPALLEIGCGTGGNLKLLQQFGRVDACEFDAEARAVAAAKSGIAVSEGALPDRIPAPDSSYDFIVLLDVLEHVDADMESLAAISRKLKPEGRLLVTVPALPWLWSAHDAKHHHFRRYTKASLRRTAEAAGMRVVEAGYFNTLLFPLIAGARFAKKMIGRDTADDAIPAAPLNAVLGRVFGLERHLVGRISLPLGASLYMVATPAAGR